MSGEPSDEDLLASRGHPESEASLAELMRRYRARLTAYSMGAFGVDAEGAQEVVQDAFLACWTSWNPTGGASVRTFLYTLTERGSIDWLRSHSSGNEVGPWPEEDVTESVESDHSTLGLCAFNGLFVPVGPYGLEQWQSIIASYFYTYKPAQRRFEISSFNLDLLPYLERASGVLGRTAPASDPPLQFLRELARQFSDHLPFRGRRPPGAPSEAQVGKALGTSPYRVRMRVFSYVGLVKDLLDDDSRNRKEGRA